MNVAETFHMQPKKSDPCRHCGGKLVTGLVYCLECGKEVHYGKGTMYKDKNAEDIVDPAAGLTELAKLVELEGTISLASMPAAQAGDASSRSDSSGPILSEDELRARELAREEEQKQKDQKV